MTVHNFVDSLRRSHKWADAPWWRTVYVDLFPGCQMQDLRADGWWQRAAIDRRLHLPNATTVTVDEKVREKDWPDFALEAFSEWHEDAQKRKPGSSDNAACDYLAYAFVPSRRCYLLPMRELQRAWVLHRSEWWRLATEESDGYRFADAPNRSAFGRRYVTRSVCVPISTVLTAITDTLSACWPASQDYAPPERKAA